MIADDQIDGTPAWWKDRFAAAGGGAVRSADRGVTAAVRLLSDAGLHADGQVQDDGFTSCIAADGEAQVAGSRALSPGAAAEAGCRPAPGGVTLSSGAGRNRSDMEFHGFIDPALARVSLEDGGKPAGVPGGSAGRERSGDDARRSFHADACLHTPPDGETGSGAAWVTLSNRRLMFFIVGSTERSSAFTGFVFAGYGTQSRYPALTAVEYDGTYFERLRFFDRKETSIAVGSGNRAAIIPFAQEDMPQRFIHGIDDEFESNFKRIVGDIVSEYFSQVSKVSADVAEQFVAGAMDAFGIGLNELKNDSEEELKSVVDILSKNELADVAHSLVELTSRKRRYSSAMETVGGPIDVAILTRNEGFIWVRRKHYFSEELNPRYFKRLRRNPGMVENGLKKEEDNDGQG